MISDLTVAQVHLALDPVVKICDEYCGKYIDTRTAYHCPSELEEKENL